MRKTIAGVDESFSFNESGELAISNGKKTVFGEQIITVYDPKIQNIAGYDTLNAQLYTMFTASGGAITPSNNTNIDLSINNTVGSFAVIRSKRSLQYKPGFANIIRFNMLFPPEADGLNNSLVFGGCGTGGDDLYFCYSNGVFGVRRSNGGLFDVHVLTVTAAATGAEVAVVQLNGVNYNVNLTNAGGNIDFTAHEIAGGLYGGLWNTQHIADTVLFIAAAVGPRTGAYSFTSATATANIVLQKQGTNLITEFVPRNQFNGNSPMISQLDLTKRQMFEIQYSWYGSGNIEFNVLNPTTARYENLHTMTFSNSSADLSLTYPTMFLQRGTASLGSTTPMTLKTGGSFGASIGTIKQTLEPRYAFTSSKSIAAATETVICAFQNRLSVNGYQNVSEIVLSYISAAADGNRSVIIKLIKNPATLGANTTANFDDFKYIDKDNSYTVYDVTASTYTGGILMASFVLGKTDSRFFDLTTSELYLSREDTFIVTATSAQVSNIDVGVSVIETR